MPVLLVAMRIMLVVTLVVFFLPVRSVTSRRGVQPAPALPPRSALADRGGSLLLLLPPGIWPAAGGALSILIVFLSKKWFSCFRG